MPNQHATAIRRGASPAGQAPRVRWRRLAPALIVAVVVTGCAPESDAGPGSVSELTSPAGPGSETPHLALDGEGVLLSWLEPEGTAEEGERSTYALRVARLQNEQWSAPTTVAAGDDFMVNWADFPSALATPDGSTIAHWLRRGGRARYDYDVRVAGDGTDQQAWSPHEDGTPTEHGFVSMVATDADEVGMTWLDGRKYQSAETSGADPEMTLRYREGSAHGPTTPEVLLDGRTCDCCQTDAAVTDRGLAIVYRDRSPEEIRDISIVRQQPDGTWSEPVTVHRDGWEIAACPVNGPAIAADGSHVAVAWFTAANDEPTVRVAFSSDAGSTFGPPTTVDGGDPIGRVDVALTASGAALVSWVEEVADGEAEIRVRTVHPDGDAGRPVTVVATSSARASGFPQMVVTPAGRFILAWTDTSEGRVRVQVGAVEE